MNIMIKKLLVSGSLLAVAVALNPAIGLADAAAGKTVYDKKCKGCHAADGSGALANAKKKPLGGPDVQGESDDDIKKTVTAGSKGGTMKPRADIAGADLDDVVAYVRTLKK